MLAQSKVGDKLLLGIVPYKGQKVFLPDNGSGVWAEEAYLPEDRRVFDLRCEVGEIWAVEVLEMREAPCSEKYNYNVMYFVKVRVLSRDEHTEEKLDRPRMEWVIEHKSGVLVLNTTRIPVRIFQKKIVESGWRITIERILGRNDQKIYSEGEVSRVNLNDLAAQELEKIKKEALAHRRTRGP